MAPQDTRVAGASAVTRQIARMARDLNAATARARDLLEADLVACLDVPYGASAGQLSDLLSLLVEASAEGRVVVTITRPFNQATTAP